MHAAGPKQLCRLLAVTARMVPPATADPSRASWASYTMPVTLAN
jgi:hypothetical protein